MERPVQTWQLQEAKAHLSEVIQVLTVRGKEEAVLVSKQEYERLIDSKLNLFDFMSGAPLKGVDIAFERDKSKIRNLDL